MQRAAVPDTPAVARNLPALPSRHIEFVVVDGNSLIDAYNLANQPNHPVGCGCPGCAVVKQSPIQQPDSTIPAAADPHPVGGSAAPPSAGGAAAAFTTVSLAAFAATDTAHAIPVHVDLAAGLLQHLGSHGPVV